MEDILQGTNYIMDSIVLDLKTVKNCIIDLRFNGGGHDQVALEIMNHFSPSETTVFTKKARLGNGYTPKQKIKLKPAEQVYHGDIFILTSYQTASAAEIMVLSSLEFPNIKKVGSNTRGIFSDKLIKKLPIGWEYSLSNEIYESMGDVSYENVGISPDYEVDYISDHSESEMMVKDSAIELILELIK